MIFPGIKKYQIKPTVPASVFFLSLDRYAQNYATPENGDIGSYEPVSGKADRLNITRTDSRFKINPSTIDLRFMATVSGEFSEHPEPRIYLRFVPAKWLILTFALFFVIGMGLIVSKSKYGFSFPVFIYVLYYFYSLNVNAIRFRIFELASPGFNTSRQGLKEIAESGYGVFKQFTNFYFIAVILFFGLLVTGAVAYMFGADVETVKALWLWIQNITSGFH